MRYLLYFMLFILFSCTENAMNQKNISVKGLVADSITRMPIANARVTILCWYHAGWDKTDYISIDTLTDKSGYFSAKFEKGYKVVVASIATKYHPNLAASEEFDGNNIEINVVLGKKTDTTGISSSINLRNYIIQNSSN